VKIGTRSLLFGAHQFLVHPLCLAVAWWRLYGFPRDGRLWVAFFVHDIGYWGLSNMDGPEGQRHPELGGRLMERWFGREWGEFTRFHSRHYAELEGRSVSRLCAADKLVILTTPRWIYLASVLLSGEHREYRAKYAAFVKKESATLLEWYNGLRANWHRVVCELAPETIYAHEARRRLQEGQ
jgi:hypothetical protein